MKTNTNLANPHESFGSMKQKSVVKSAKETVSKVENLIFDTRLGHPDLPEASLGATRSRLNINVLTPVLLLNLLSSCESLARCADF